MKKYYVLPVMLGLLLCSAVGAEEIITPETYASYYGEAFNGKPTSSGEIFDMYAYTAAHKTLPFGTLLEVTNLENGKKVVVRVNDRGPFIANREIDLSKAAAESLGMISRGITRVSIKKVHSLDHAALVATNDKHTDQPPAEESKEEPEPVVSEPVAETAAKAETSSEQGKQSEQLKQSAQHTDSVPAQEKKRVYTPAHSGVLWRIQLGAFTREENALRLVVAVRKTGLEPAYERTENSIRVVLPGIRPSDLEAVKEALAAGGFTDYVIRQESW